MTAWESLLKSYQASVTAACAESYNWTVAKYDAQNTAALRRLVASGTQVRPFPREIMEASYKAAYELYDEEAATNPKFKKVYEAWTKFRDEEHLWFRVSEQSFDNFMYAKAAQKKS